MFHRQQHIHLWRSYLRFLGLALTHLAVLVLLVAATGVSANPQLSESDSGRRVMVEYIVHFAHHLQWPIEVFTGADAPFRICVMGGDRLREPLAARLRHHRVQGRLVQLEKVNDGELIRARSCQIIVLGEMERSSLIKAVSSLEFFPVLTVSDAERFAASGGMVQFVSNGAGLALQFNKTMLDRADLKVGNSLFRLSRELKLN